MKKGKALSIVLVALLISTIGITITNSVNTYITRDNFRQTLVQINLGQYMFFNVKPTVTVYNESQMYKNYTLLNMAPNTYILVVYFLGQIAAIDWQGNVVLRKYGFGWHGNVRQVDETHFLYENFGSLKEFDTRSGKVSWSWGNFFTDAASHDFLVLPNGNILAQIHDIRKVGNKKYEGNRIVEINKATKKIVWNWSTWDHFNLTENCSECINKLGNMLAFDWIHMNSLAYDNASDTIITNLRNLDKMVKINHSIPGDSSNSIVWMLGGLDSDFDMSKANFSHGHGCEIIYSNETENITRIITFDNGLHRGWASSFRNPFSRAIIIEANETDWTAEIVWNYNESGTGGFYSEIWSYAEQLPNSNILITDGFNGRVIEVNYTTQEKIWELQLPPGFGIYRAYRVQQPFDPGKFTEISPLGVYYFQNLEIPYISTFEVILLVICAVSIGVKTRIKISD